MERRSVPEGGGAAGARREIAEFDEKSAYLLAHHRRRSGRARETPGSTLVGRRASMAALVETQKAKWAYMFDKIDKELRK
jgi:hypothetical protein